MRTGRRNGMQIEIFCCLNDNLSNKGDIAFAHPLYVLILAQTSAHFNTANQLA